MNKNTLKIETLERICKILKVPIYQFFTDIDIDELIKKVKIYENHLKILLTERCYSKGIDEIPGELKEFEEFKALNTIYDMFNEPELRKALDTVMKPRFDQFEKIKKSNKKK
jgi:3-deoxy-D-manno-octulosonic acid (KDO) 8-phosphate synthase